MSTYQLTVCINNSLKMEYQIHANNKVTVYVESSPKRGGGQVTNKHRERNTHAGVKKKKSAPNQSMRSRHSPSSPAKSHNTIRIPEPSLSPEYRTEASPNSKLSSKKPCPETPDIFPNVNKCHTTGDERYTDYMKWVPTSLRAPW